jgi:hypothetical protein
MILGDRSLAMAELYSREHEKKTRVSATMLKLEGSKENESSGRVEKHRMHGGKLFPH